MRHASPRVFPGELSHETLLMGAAEPINSGWESIVFVPDHAWCLCRPQVLKTSLSKRAPCSLSPPLLTFFSFSNFRA